MLLFQETKTNHNAVIRCWCKAYIGPVAKGSIEWLFVWTEKVFNVSQACDFKDLWLLLNNLPVKYE